ncbi:GNAT family N-acetyltransferase [Nocardiopsis sp. FIRDI 009]|uniref:GNAT family N-acetyltransferase n=1 Tax=Nocardiopsis sp. FIRDI 009 TaxID=714197 RepID=UPI000E234EBE|nr:GNAT family N-acetyltransferase [Nocardiopsis sp. FIRDI 009]
MTGWIIRAATENDLTAVVELLNEVADDLAARGISQWSPGWMSGHRMLPMIQQGETWVAHDADGQLAATVSLSTAADSDFWSAEEQATPALYLNKLASRQSGAGAWAIEWALRYAGALGYPVVRLDAWASNEQLHEYYRRRGWTHLRTMRVPGRNSGALFEIATRKPTMIIETTTNVHSPDSPRAGLTTRPEVLLEVTGAVVKGVAPFMTDEHQLSVPLGVVRPVWHDGTTWRVGNPGWGDDYAEYVVRWPALDALSTDTRYSLVAPKAEDQDVTLIPA